MGGDFCPSSPLLFHITFSFIGSLSRPDPICLFHEWPLKLRLHRYLLNQQNQRLLLLLGFRPMGKYSRILLWGPMVLLCGLGKGSRVRKERAGAQQGKGGWWGGGRPLAFPGSQGWLVSLELCFFLRTKRRGKQRSGPLERQGTANLYKCPLWASFQVSKKHTLPFLSEPSFCPHFQFTTRSLLLAEDRGREG